MAKVGGLLSVRKVCISILCKYRISVSMYKGFLIKFEHPKSTISYFNQFSDNLSVTDIS